MTIIRRISMCGTMTIKPKLPSRKELYVAKCLVGLCVLL